MKTMVVIGKPKIHPDERDHIYNLGVACALRGVTLRTTDSPGVGQLVSEGYKAAGKEPQYLEKGKDPDEGADETIVFTDLKYQKSLTERLPDWEKRNWIVVHNRKATQNFGAVLMDLMHELGVKMDGGSE